MNMDEIEAAYLEEGALGSNTAIDENEKMTSATNDLSEDECSDGDDSARVDEEEKTVAPITDGRQVKFDSF
jgi:hypothetical protein